MNRSVALTTIPFSMIGDSTLDKRGRILPNLARCQSKFSDRLSVMIFEELCKKYPFFQQMLCKYVHIS